MARTSTPPREAVQKWSELSFEDEDSALTAAKRAQIVARMELRLEQTITAEANTRRRARVYAAFGCAAAVCLAAFGAWRWNVSRSAPLAALAHVQSVEGSVSVTHGGVTGVAATPVAPVAGETTLGPGDDVVTAPDGRTRVTLPDGVSLTLGEASRLSLPKSTLPANPRLETIHEQVSLNDGVVSVRVPHLTQGRTFAVKTPDAEVTVHGTAFTVEVGEFVSPDEPLHSGAHAADATISTRVRVSEGVVSVTSAGREVFVRAGMQWISPHAEPTQRRVPAPLPTTAALSAGPPPSALPALDSSASGASAPPTGPKTIPSSLADQTRLLESAMSASRNGDYHGAIGSLNELLRRYPASRLEPEARVQLFRALAAAHDAAGAAREARRYLVEYPEGYAHEEAKKLALGH